MQTCPGKEKQNSNYSRKFGRLQEETKAQQAKKEKIIYQRNVIKIKVNMINVKDHKEQENINISENEDDRACSMLVHCGKHIQRRKRGLHLTNVRCPKCAPEDTDL